VRSFSFAIADCEIADFSIENQILQTVFAKSDGITKTVFSQFSVLARRQIVQTVFAQL